MEEQKVEKQQQNVGAGEKESFTLKRFWLFRQCGATSGSCVIRESKLGHLKSHRRSWNRCSVNAADSANFSGETQVIICIEALYNEHS